MTQLELAAILNPGACQDPTSILGTDVRGGGTLNVPTAALLGRHVAVLGATGQGKSCFTAAVLQQFLALPKPRIVIFDINGEYEAALARHCTGTGDLKISSLGGQSARLKIPYVALGRHGLGRLLLPSDKTQRPALNFALESLRHVKWFENEERVGPAGALSPVLFDDCRKGGEDEARNLIDALRTKKTSALACEWPAMRALGCLVAESHSLQRVRNSVERNSFNYGNVAPLITRIRRYCEDPQFVSVVDVGGSKPAKNGELDWQAESSKLVEEIFGADNTNPDYAPAPAKVRRR